MTNSNCYLLLYFIKLIILKMVQLEGYNLYMRLLRQRHFFHMVTPSPWPFCTSINVFFIALAAVMYMHNYINGGLYLILGFLNFFFILSLWFRDIIREATFEGMHTNKKLIVNSYKK